MFSRRDDKCLTDRKCWSNYRSNRGPPLSDRRQGLGTILRPLFFILPEGVPHIIPHMFRVGILGGVIGAFGGEFFLKRGGEATAT